MLINRYISNSSYFKNNCLFLFTLYVVNKGLRLIVALFFSIFEFFRIIAKKEGKNIVYLPFAAETGVIILKLRWLIKGTPQSWQSLIFKFDSKAWLPRFKGLILHIQLLTGWCERCQQVSSFRMENVIQLSVVKGAFSRSNMLCQSFDKENNIYLEIPAFNKILTVQYSMLTLTWSLWEIMETTGHSSN